jgi:nitric oxide synthase-interacting protein
LSNILAQKKEIKRLEKTRGKEIKEAEEDRAREDSEAKERAVQEFEKIQMGLEAKLASSSSAKTIVGREGGKILVEEDVDGGKRGEKRKFELDEDELLRIAREERAKARKAIDDEKVYILIRLSAPVLISAGLQDHLALLLGSVHHAFIKHPHDAA